MPLTQKANSRHRHWACLEDGEVDLTSAVAAWAGRYRGGRCWWCGDGAPEPFEAIAPAQARRWLGDECDLLAFDARERFDADAFGALSGTVVAGGTLLLLVSRAPPPGRFLGRLLRCVAMPRNTVQDGPEAPVSRLDGADPMARTADQALAVEQLLRVARGHRRRPRVLTADRGRGKSAAMGIAAARLLQQGITPVLVTAPRRAAVGALFDMAYRILGAAAGGGLVFLPPDALVRYRGNAGLVLVDEAAAIPVPLLEQLLQRYARIAFATTTHGYEGTGRGFTVRFKRVLDRMTPQWREYELQTPIRWAPGDPLEQLTFDALLLDAEPASAASVRDATRDNSRFERVDRDRLLDDEPLLRELFGLLVMAHYQTRPSDLQRLLDDPEVSVWAALYDGHVAATALVALEGGFEQGLAVEVAAGRRRPRGHLLPQSLAAHVGTARVACLRYMRVMRIAVHPAVQRRGLGGALLARIRQAACDAPCDMLGTSFGATVDLMRFWRSAGLRPVRLGLARDAASGTHSVVWLAALHDGAESMMRALRDEFFDGLRHLLSDELRDLEPGLVASVLHEAPLPRRVERDQDVLERYIRVERDYAGAVAPLWRRVWRSGGAGGLERLASAQRDALVMRVPQKRSWAEVAADLKVPGRAQVEKVLRDAAAALLAVN